MSISLICEKIYKKDIILYSIITPIYNQQDIIVDNIKSYINYTEDNFEIILIIDCCSDNTKNNILHFINNYNNYSNISNNFCQIKIYETDEPLFETRCDNFGFKIAQGKYLLEIQADMEMNSDYKSKMIEMNKLSYNDLTIKELYNLYQINKCTGIII